jgi:NAD(P)H-dependent FMN reductase
LNAQLRCPFERARTEEAGLPRLGLVIASTRPGRVGLPVAEWFASIAREHGAFEIEVLDLAEIALPFLDEPNHPRLRRYTQPHTFAWSAQVEACDAFVFVMPEYNYGLNAPLKNAIDYLNHEWRYKPVGFCAYGGIAGGARAVQMVKQVITTLRMVPVVDAVFIPFVGSIVDEDDRLQATEVMIGMARAMLDELVRVEASLKPLRG